MARSFNGTTDNATVNGYTALNADMTAATVSFWTKPDYTGSPASVNAFYSKAFATIVARALWSAYHFTDGKVYYHLNGNNAAGGYAWSPTSGTWYNITEVWNGTNVTFYVNGTQLGQTVDGSSSGTSTNAFYPVNNRYNGDTNNQLGHGDFAEFAVWNVALSTAQISSLVKGISANRIRRDALILYIPVWGTSTTEANLISGANQCTISGTTVKANPPMGPYVSPRSRFLRQFFPHPGLTNIGFTDSIGLNTEYPLSQGIDVIKNGTEAGSISTGIANGVQRSQPVWVEQY